jgi:membrane protein
MTIYWAVIILAPLLIGASLSLTSWLVGLSMGYAKQMPVFGMLTLKVMPVILTTLAFSLLFRWVPNRYVSIRDALIGGVVAAITFEAMNRGFGFFVSHFSTYKLVYGAFASVPIFLLWVYFSWLTILMGALIAASLSRWQHRGTQQLNAAEQFYFAVLILDLMHEGLIEGELQTVSSLSKKLNLAFEATEMLMEKLQSANMVRKLDGRGWKMIRTPKNIMTEELSDIFLLDVSNLPSQVGDAEIHAWFASVMRGTAEPKKQMLSTLITR